jgi:excisionase family DNA binding protein
MEAKMQEQLNQLPDNLPGISTTEDFSRALGYTTIYIARLCKQGKIPAAKVGKQWRINTAEALRAMGLMHDSQN